MASPITGSGSLSAWTTDYKYALSQAVPRWLKRNFEDTLVNVSVTLSAFKDAGGIERNCTGPTIIVPVQTNNLAVSDISDVTAPTTNTPASITDALRFEWMHKRVEGINIAETDIKMLKNSREGMAAYVQQITKNALEVGAVDVNDDLWDATGTGGAPSTTSLGSIPYYVNTPIFQQNTSALAASAGAGYYFSTSGGVQSQTLGGKTRSTAGAGNEWMMVPYVEPPFALTGQRGKNVYVGSSTPLDTRIFAEVRTNVKAGTGKDPDLGFMNADLHSSLEDVIIGLTRYRPESSSRLGNIPWYGNTRLVCDLSCPSGTIYFINTDKLKLYCDFDNATAEQVELKELVMHWKFWFSCQLVLVNNRNHGFMTGMVAD